MTSSRLGPAGLFSLVLVACGGRIDSDVQGGAPPLAELGAERAAGGLDDVAAGDDPNAVAVAACGGLGTLVAEPFGSREAVRSALVGRWLLCPASLSTPDPPFGKASWVGVELAGGGVGRPLVLETGARPALGPSTFAWSTETSPPSLRLVTAGGDVRARVEVARDRAQARLVRDDLGGTEYTLVRVTR